MYYNTKVMNKNQILLATYKVEKVLGEKKQNKTNFNIFLITDFFEELIDWNVHIPGARDALQQVSIHFVSFTFLLRGIVVHLK